MKIENAVRASTGFGAAVIAGWVASRLEQNPVAVFVVGLSVFVLVILALYYKIPAIVGSLFELEATVVSVLVFDGNEVLLLRDEERHWYVPPSAHVGCFRQLK